MPEPLTAADLERMRERHVRMDCPGGIDTGYCEGCSTHDGGEWVVRQLWPCDAARLLDFIAAYDLRAIEQWWPESKRNVERMLANGWTPIDGGIGGTVYVPEEEP